MTPERWDLSTSEMNQLANFLDRLRTRTADARSSRLSVHNQNRVLNFLQQMQEDRDDFRSMAMERISEALSSCDDRVALLMNEIDVQVNIRKAQQSRNPERALKRVACELMVLQVAKEHAIAKCNEYTQNGVHHDPIEVHLVFEVAMANRFDLQIGAREMLFGASVSRRAIREAGDAAQRLVYNQAERQAFRSNWKPWQQFERKQQAESLSYAEIPLNYSYNASDDDQCMFTLDSYPEIEDPVVLNGRLYSHAELMTWWIENGCDPLNRSQAVSLSDIKRVPTAAERDNQAMRLRESLEFWVMQANTQQLPQRLERVQEILA